MIHKKYIINKVDGSPMAPEADYFVLRLDSAQSDQKHREACVKAILAYADAIKGHIPELAKDIINKYEKCLPLPDNVKQWFPNKEFADFIDGEYVFKKYGVDEFGVSYSDNYCHIANNGYKYYPQPGDMITSFDDGRIIICSEQAYYFRGEY